MRQKERLGLGERVRLDRAGVLWCLAGAPARFVNQRAYLMKSSSAYVTLLLLASCKTPSSVDDDLQPELASLPLVRFFAPFLLSTQPRFR